MEDARTALVRAIDASYAHEVAITRAAAAWFDSKRPLDWSLREHIAHVEVNCTTRAEKALARAVVYMLIEELK